MMSFFNQKLEEFYSKSRNLSREDLRYSSCIYPMCSILLLILCFKSVLFLLHNQKVHISSKEFIPPTVGGFVLVKFNSVLTLNYNALEIYAHKNVSVKVNVEKLVFLLMKNVLLANQIPT